MASNWSATSFVDCASAARRPEQSPPERLRTARDGSRHGFAMATGARCVLLPLAVLSGRLFDVLEVGEEGYPEGEDRHHSDHPRIFGGTARRVFVPGDHAVAMLRAVPILP